MKAEYKRDLQNNYLIFEISGDVQESSYRIRMAEQNKIAGLLPFHTSWKDGKLQLHYEITSLQPLSSMFEKKTMSCRDLVFVLSGIRNTLEEMQKYLLNPSQIIFDPEYMFVGPDRKSMELCCVPETQHDAPITVLAEYMLKRLDHEDRQAVALGYGFYQKSLEENFSLQRTLKEMLALNREEERYKWGAVSEGDRTAEEAEEAYPYGAAGRETFSSESLYSEDGDAAASENAYEVVHRERIRKGRGQREYGRKEYGQKEYAQKKPGQKECIRKELEKSSGKNMGKLFSIVHPAVLLSALFFTAALEAVFYFGYLSLTETGGIFFLMLSVEMLANKYWRSRAEQKKREAHRWIEEEEEESEIYRMLQEEMYELAPEEEPIQETQCLVPSAREPRMYLVFQKSASVKDYHDISVGSEMVCVGKIKGESDVILDSPTVSRVHARLFCRDGTYYVRDMNSRNGTFCNGERLRPQEERALAPGDTVAFAEVSYRVAVENDSYERGS